MTSSHHARRVNDETSGSLLPLDGGDIYVHQDGPRDAPALVLIHGSASSTRSWDALVPLLTGSHHIIRIDLLGHGRSAVPDDGDYAIPEQARRVGEVMDRIGVERAVVVGHSSGGLAATALAEQRPELVAALALINTGPHMGAFIAQDFAVEPSQWPELTDEQLRQAIAPAFSRAGFQIPQELIDSVREMTFVAFGSSMRASLEYLKQQSIPERLAALGTPLLVIFGQEDRRWQPASFADYRAVAGAVVESLPGIGHSPILEDPPGTAAPLLAFAAIHAAPAH